MTKPNVDWSILGLIHPTTAEQDNMRAVRMQLGGLAAEALGANAESMGSRLTQDTPVPPSCQCPYGWHAINKDCYFIDPPPIPYRDGWPAMSLKPIGVGETMFSPEEIAQFRDEALWLYQESMNQVHGINAQRYLEGDTEFSDSDVEDYYLGKAT